VQYFYGGVVSFGLDVYSIGVDRNLGTAIAVPELWALFSSTINQKHTKWM